MSGTRRRAFVAVFLGALGVWLAAVAAGAATYASGFRLVQSVAWAPDLPAWWPLFGVALFASIVFQVWCVRRPTQLKRDGVIMITALWLLVALVAWRQIPAAAPYSPVGPAGPWALIGAAAAFLAYAATAGATWLRLRAAYDQSPLMGLLASLLALGLAICVALSARDLADGYLNSVNEQLTDAASGPPGRPVRSALTGGILWQISAPPNQVGWNLAATSEGLALASTYEVLGLDAASGKTRWRYARTDVGDTPLIFTADGGGRLIVHWDNPNSGYFVLSAADGHRLARWPESYADDDLEATDPPVLVRSVSAGSDSVSVRESTGGERWRWSPGPCKDLLAGETAATVVVDVQTGCGSEPNRFVGLDARTGKQRWAIDEPPGRLAAAGNGVALLLSRPTGSLVAIDAATGQTRWHATAAPDCSQLSVQASETRALLVCTTSGSADQTTAALYNIAGGGLVSQARFSGAYHSTTITADGRAVLLGRVGGGCWAGVLAGTEPASDVPLPSDHGTCEGLSVLAVGDEVVLRDGEHARLSALR